MGDEEKEVTSNFGWVELGGCGKGKVSGITSPSLQRHSTVP
jgi:hypothetical protein